MCYNILMLIKILSLLFGSYLMGSIPFAYLIVLLLKKETDIRTLGSGNVGATNVLRVLGIGPGALVLFLDAFKGWLAVNLAKVYNPFSIFEINYFWLVVLAGFLAMVGHIFPVWLKFKGGKGVATGLGVLLALNWQIFLITFLVSAGVIAVTRYVSLGSLTGAVLFLVLMIYWRQPLPYQIIGFLAAGFIFFRHRSNLKRLLKGEEQKIGEKQKTN